MKETSSGLKTVEDLEAPQDRTVENKQFLFSKDEVSDATDPLTRVVRLLCWNLRITLNAFVYMHSICCRKLDILKPDLIARDRNNARRGHSSDRMTWGACKTLLVAHLGQHIDFVGIAVKGPDVSNPEFTANKTASAFVTSIDRPDDPDTTHAELNSLFYVLKVEGTPEQRKRAIEALKPIVSERTN